MKITPESIAEIARADEALAASETPSMRAVRQRVEEKLEARRVAAYEAEYEAAHPEVHTDAVPPTPAAAQRTSIPMGATSKHRLERSVSLRLEQLTRRLRNAEKRSAAEAAVVREDIAALKDSLTSTGDISSAADAYERGRECRKQLRSARAKGDEAEVKRLEAEAALISREQRAFTSYPTGHGRG